MIQVRLTSVSALHVLDRHYCKIQDKEDTFYQNFHIVVCGLDSIVARRWLNGMIMSLVTYGEDGTVDGGSIIPIVDGGTEGFKGNARVIIPTQTPCVECTLDLYPPQVRHFPPPPYHVVDMYVLNRCELYAFLSKTLPLADT